MSYVTNFDLMTPPVQFPPYYWGGLNTHTRSDAGGEEYQEYSRFYSGFQRGRIRIQIAQRRSPDRDCDYFSESLEEWGEEE